MTDRRQHPQARDASLRSLADPALNAGGRVFDNTREFAAQALERAAEKMRDLRYGVADTATAAQRRVHRYAGVTSRYIAQRPVKAALIAAGVGALIAAWVMASRRRGTRY